MIVSIRRKLKNFVVAISPSLMKFFLVFKRKKYVLLIAQHPLMFHYIRPIHQMLEDDPDIVVTICFPWPERFKEGEIDELKDKFNLRTIHYRIAQFIRWCLIIQPDHRPIFHPDSPKIRIEHGFYNGKLVHGNKYMFGPLCRDENDQIIYEKMFVSSEFVCSVIKKSSPEFASRVRAVGNILMDEIYSYTDQKLEIFEKIHLDPNRPTIMVASSWGPSSFIQRYGFDFIKQLPEITAKYNVIISIHFMNHISENSGGHNWNEILEQVNGPNVYISPPGSESYHLLANADLLMMDMTSLGLYYPIFERPIIYFCDTGVEYEESSLNNELRNSVCTSSDVSNLYLQIDNAFALFDKQKLRALSDKITSYKGKAKLRFKEEIYDSLSDKNDSAYSREVPSSKNNV